MVILIHWQLDLQTRVLIPSARNCHSYMRCAVACYEVLRRGADKSLARPGRKQATATKLGIYSTYSTRSSIHFLARYSNSASHSKKKKLRRFPRQQWPSRRMKNGDVLFFSVQGTGGSPTGPNSENRIGDPDIGSPGRSVSCGLSCKNTTPLVNFPRRFSFKMSFNCTRKDE